MTRDDTENMKKALSILQGNSETPKEEAAWLYPRI